MSLPTNAPRLPCILREHVPVRSGQADGRGGADVIRRTPLRSSALVVHLLLCWIRTFCGVRYGSVGALAPRPYPPTRTGRRLWPAGPYPPHPPPHHTSAYSNRRVRPSGRAARVRAMQSARGDPPAIVLTPQSVSAKAARALRAGAGAGAGAGAAGASAACTVVTWAVRRLQRLTMPPHPSSRPPPAARTIPPHPFGRDPTIPYPVKRSNPADFSGCA